MKKTRGSWEGPTMSISKKILLSRDMSEDDRCVLIKKTFAGTIYENAGNIKEFTKTLNESQKILEAKWKVECERTGGMYERFNE